MEGFDLIWFWQKLFSILHQTILMWYRHVGAQYRLGMKIYVSTKTILNLMSLLLFTTVFNARQLLQSSLSFIIVL